MKKKYIWANPEPDIFHWMAKERFAKWPYMCVCVCVHARACGNT